MELALSFDPVSQLELRSAGLVTSAHTRWAISLPFALLYAVSF